jgi:hypothetical protein
MVDTADYAKPAIGISITSRCGDNDASRDLISDEISKAITAKLADRVNVSHR